MGWSKKLWEADGGVAYGYSGADDSKILRPGSTPVKWPEAISPDGPCSEHTVLCSWVRALEPRERGCTEQTLLIVKKAENCVHRLCSNSKRKQFLWTILQESLADVPRIRFRSCFYTHVSLEPHSSRKEDNTRVVGSCKTTAVSSMLYVCRLQK